MDESGSMLSATASDVGYTPGLDGQALTTRPTSSIVVRHDAALDTTEYTVEAWVWLDSVPGPGDYYGVAEKYGHWRLRIDPGGAAACHIGTRWGRREISGGAVPPRTWTHVACSVGGGRQMVSIDGATVAGQSVFGVVSSTDDVHLAEDADTGAHQLPGAIDTVRVWSRVITDSDWCTLSGPCRVP